MSMSHRTQPGGDASDYDQQFRGGRIANGRDLTAPSSQERAPLTLFARCAQGRGMQFSDKGPTGRGSTIHPPGMSSVSLQSKVARDAFRR